MSEKRLFVTRDLRRAGPALPLFVPWEWKWPAGLISCGVGFGLYVGCNRLMADTTRELPLTALDHAIPLLPWSAWVYASGLLFMPAAYALNRCVASLGRHLWSFAALNLVTAACFLAWPVTYPRADFPLPPGQGALLALIRAVDSPACCVPSLHASVPALVALGFLDDRREWFPVMALWALALAGSALTTKQHYIWDVAAGWALAGAMFWVFHRRLPARLTGASASRN